MNIANSLTLTIAKNGVANLIFDCVDEKVNKLSELVLVELEKALNVIDGNKAIRILIITSAKRDIFIAGADIKEIKDITNQQEALQKVSRGQDILDKISKLKIPTIAVIDGACLGGGLELALACKYRLAVANPKTSLGLPEVNLGIIPGFGGTQRLPKLIGLQESLKMILSGKPIDVRKAFKIGLVDDISREEFLEENLGIFCTRILEDGDQNQYLQKREASSRKRFIFESFLLGKLLIFYLARKELYQKTRGHYPAPFYALEVVKRTYRRTYAGRGFKVELEAFCELVTSETCKNLIEIFFTSETLKKDSGVEDRSVVTKNIQSAALLGAGVMGGGIAWLFANHNLNIRIKDITQNAIAVGYNQIVKIFNQLQKIKKLTSDQISLKIAKVSDSLDFTGFEKVDLVVEAVVENIAIKKKILAEAESKIKKSAIIVSNTSSLSISEMAQGLENPERFAGMHFFNPVNKMPLVEVIRGIETNNETIANIVALAKKLGKTPIVVKDVPGFLVNRILLPYLNEAAYLLQEGAEILRVDSLIEKFGMPMGPFVLADVVGIDVGVKVAHSLQEGYGERMKVAAILEEIQANHPDLLGKKSQQGFYLYKENGEPGQVNPKIGEVLASMNLTKTNLTDTAIIDRCILTMVNEAAKCLVEGVVKNARYLDMAMIMGTGFPAFRGGLLRYADNYGIETVVSKLQVLNKKHGKRFEPSHLLLEMAQKKQNFYGN